MLSLLGDQPLGADELAWLTFRAKAAKEISELKASLGSTDP